MALEELKEQLSSRLSDVASRIQDTALYQNLKEKFDDLPGHQQRIVMLMAGLIFGFFIFSFPYDYWSASEQELLSFSAKRDLIRELLRVTKETNEAVSFPAPPPVGQIKADIEMRLQQYQLAAEQLVGVNVQMNSSAGLIPANRQEGALKLILKKLNLRQVVDIVANLQTLHPSVKLGTLNIDSHIADPRYLDATLEFIVIKVPQVSVESEEEVPAAPIPKRGRK